MSSQSNQRINIIYYLLIIFSLFLFSCKSQENLSSHIGVCFKVGDSVDIVEAILFDNSSNSHNVGILYYNPGFIPTYQRDIISYNYLKKIKKNVTCPEKKYQIKKYDWNKYNLGIKNTSFLDLHNYKLRTEENFQTIVSKLIDMNTRIPLYELLTSEELTIEQMYKIEKMYKIKIQSLDYLESNLN